MLRSDRARWYPTALDREGRNLGPCDQTHGRQVGEALGRPLHEHAARVACRSSTTHKADVAMGQQHAGLCPARVRTLARP